MTEDTNRELAERVEAMRVWGRQWMRPAGLESDRACAPLPVDHPYFEAYVRNGGGRTAYKGAGRRDKVETAVILAEEAAYWDRGMGVANPGPGLPEGMVLAAGTEEQKERFLGPFIDPDRPRWASLAMTEPSGGSDTAAFKTKAVQDGSHWIITGSKCFIGNASRADWILVQATIEPDKPRGRQRTFFIEHRTPGLTGFKIERKMGLMAYESTSFVLDECRVPTANLLGGAEQAPASGHGSAMRNLNATRPIVAASAIGMARSAYDEAVDFAQRHALLGDARTRMRLESFDRKLRGAWLLTLKAARLADDQQPNIVEASMAKWRAADVLEAITQEAMDMLGAVAAQGEHLIEKLFRDSKAMNIVEGTGQIQRVIVARNQVGLPR